MSIKPKPSKQSVSAAILNKDSSIDESSRLYTNSKQFVNPPASSLSNDEKKEIIANSFREILTTLELDIHDDSLKNTPYRVAKMYIDEIFSGLDIKNKPKVSFFENETQYTNMVLEKNIDLKSICEHHFLPIVGQVHVAYYPKKRLIGLSKLHRIVDFYARRPQVQEKLTMQIANELQDLLDTEDVLVIIDAHHFCVSFRGIADQTSSTFTLEKRGKFLKEKNYKETLQQLK